MWASNFSGKKLGQMLSRAVKMFISFGSAIPFMKLSTPFMYLVLDL
jgi:hypothetical protein